jgi:hypothetical protein
MYQVTIPFCCRLCETGKKDVQQKNWKTRLIRHKQINGDSATFDPVYSSLASAPARCEHFQTIFAES